MVVTADCSKLKEAAELVRSPPLMPKSPVITAELLTVVMPEVAAMLMVVAEVAKLKVAAVVVRSPPFTAKSPPKVLEPVDEVILPVVPAT